MNMDSLFFFSPLKAVYEAFSCSRSLNAIEDVSIPFNPKDIKSDVSTEAPPVVKVDFKKGINYSEIWSKIDDTSVLTTKPSSKDKGGKSRNMNKVKEDTSKNTFQNERMVDYATSGKIEPKKINIDTRLLMREEIRTENFALKISSPQYDQQVNWEYILPAKQMNLLFKEFPLLNEIISSESEKLVKVHFTSRAAITLVKFMFHPEKLYIKNVEVALETYALARKLAILELCVKCINFLISIDGEDLLESYLEKIVRYIDYYEIHEIKKFWHLKWKSIIKKFRHTNLSAFEASHNPKCFILWTDLEQNLYDIFFLLYPVERIIDHSSDADISNRVLFKTISGSYDIKGVQVKLNSGFKGKGSSIGILYKVKYLGSKSKTFLEEELDINLAPSIPIMFQKEARVNSKKFVEISVTLESVRVSLCSQIHQQEYVQKTQSGDFQVNLFSSRKSVSGKPIFFIEKIFYHNNSV